MLPANPEATLTDNAIPTLRRGGNCCKRPPSRQFYPPLDQDERIWGYSAQSACV
jgi:hypothetical protein